MTFIPDLLTSTKHQCPSGLIGLTPLMPIRKTYVYEKKFVTDRMALCAINCLLRSRPL